MRGRRTFVAAVVAVAAVAFWDRVGPGAIAGVQHLARHPLHAEPGLVGDPIETMRDFQTWFREHDDLRRDPWPEPG